MKAIFMVLAGWLLSIYFSSSFERHSNRWSNQQQQQQQHRHHQMDLSAATLLTDAEVSLALSYIRTNYGRQPDGVYIHVPFCRRRCFYCSFPIKVVGDRMSTVEAESRMYTDLLIKEMRATATASQWESSSVSTIYFGGGTPSLLPDACIAEILDCISNLFGLHPNCEITLEMDPGTFDASRLEILRKIGINRVSMGVQSFDSAMLKACGRAHTVKDTEAAVAALHSAGITNFNIDLISSLPGLTLDVWRDTLLKAVETGCTHLSVYDLQIEENTAFGRWYTPGQFPLPSEEDSAAMYAMAVDTLSGAAFKHYEVSNYCRDGKRSRHNEKYWQNKPLWGFGVGAASYIRGKRLTRPPTIEKYREYVDTLLLQQQPQTPPPLPPLLPHNDASNKNNNRDSDSDSDSDGDGDGDCDGVGDGDSDGNSDRSALERLEVSDHLLETVMLSLRTAAGLDLTLLRSIYGTKTSDAITESLGSYILRSSSPSDLPLGADAEAETEAEEAYKKTLVEFLDSSERIILGEFSAAARVRLTDPSGFLVSNDIISSVFAAISCL